MNVPLVLAFTKIFVRVKSRDGPSFEMHTCEEFN
jgi:hypothetical protein